MNVTIHNIQGDANSIKITISSRTATLLRVTSYSAMLLTVCKSVCKFEGVNKYKGIKLKPVTAYNSPPPQKNIKNAVRMAAITYMYYYILPFGAYFIIIVT